MSDKIHELAEKLAQNASVFVPRLAAEGFERILRAELASLLEAADDVAMLGPGTLRKQAIDRLATELQGWTARTPDGR